MQIVSGNELFESKFERTESWAFQVADGDRQGRILVYSRQIDEQYQQPGGASFEKHAEDVDRRDQGQGQEGERGGRCRLAQRAAATTDKVSKIAVLACAAKQ